MQALGGGVAVVVGSLVFSSVGPFGTLDTSVSGSYVRSSGILLAQNRFSDCTVTSSNEGAGSGSLGSSSVYGGALAVIQSPQMSIFNNGLLSPESAAASSGYDFMVSVSDSNFSSCSAAAFSASACPIIPGSTSGGGGAVYVRGVALSRFSVERCIFKSSNVSVACGTTGSMFRSSGGALAVEAAGSSRTVVAVSKCSFIRCAAIGASLGNLFVRGGAMSVADAEVVWVEDSQFVNCSITNAVKSYNPSNKLQLVNGGAGASISFALNVSVLRCIFDSAGYADESDVSTGLLVLFSGPSAARVLVCDTVLNASQVVLRVGCTNKTNHAAAECSPSAVKLSMVNSSISQKAPFPPRDDFDLVGSALLALHDGVTPLFDRCRMKCAKADFAVFKNKTDEFSIVQHECKPCPPFRLARASDEVQLDRVADAVGVDRCFPADAGSGCPFGISKCQTFVDVSKGFWTCFQSTGAAPLKLAAVLRCPRGYCECGDAACRLAPMLSASSTTLCSGRRTGTLCGGCLPNFTQSMDGVSCISNDECSRDLWWVWMLSVLGFVVIGLIITPRSEQSDGLLSCLLFYLQIASFASSLNDSSGSNAITEYSQVRSVVALFARSCYARNMSAYDAAAARLVGPLFVLLFSLAWTWLLRVLQPLLHQRGAFVQVSYGGTAISAILYVFSSAATVVFTLVECTSYTDSASSVVFIDGTVPCFDGRWKGLVAVVAMLCLFPVALAAALLRNKLPASARAAVCRPFTERMFYWGAVTLGFRLLMSLTQFLRVDYPSLLAYVRLCLALGMLILLGYTRPYIHKRTFWVDVICYVCLIAQFGLQALVESFDVLGTAPSSTANLQNLFSGASTAIVVLRSCCILRLFRRDAF